MDYGEFSSKTDAKHLNIQSQLPPLNAKCDTYVVKCLLKMTRSDTYARNLTFKINSEDYEDSVSFIKHSIMADSEMILKRIVVAPLVTNILNVAFTEHDNERYRLKQTLENI